jgi:hemolysin activation/secretion protein
LEVRVPVLTIPEWETLVQLAPFVDYGYAWNSGDRPAPDPQSLCSVGIGAQWQWGDRFTARLDYGIPLINDDASGNSLQESGLLFSIVGELY